MLKLARWPCISVLILALPLLAVALAAGAPAARGQTTDDTAAAPAQAAVGEPGKRCLRCHDAPPATLMLHTVHAQMGDSRTPFADRQCETCHGPSDAHVSSTPKEGEKRALVDVVFGPKSPTPAATQNAVCLGCHQGGLRMNWAVSPHAGADIACATCHDLHAIKDKVVVRATQPEICFTCHAEQRAQTFKRSHHPIREGLVVCSDCHNPHGTFGRKLLKLATVNETCFQCHAEKRGPFLWEHAPVTDSCMNCHTPHGSSQPRLLIVRAAWLCQQCHTEAQHPSTLYSGEFFDTTSTSLSRLVGKSCLNCHAMIHGSNHPSGARLTR
jgi:DmsE family decaheme c-type cytochrome